MRWTPLIVVFSLKATGYNLLFKVDPRLAIAIFCMELGTGLFIWWRDQ